MRFEEEFDLCRTRETGRKEGETSQARRKLGKGSEQSGDVSLPVGSRKHLQGRVRELLARTQPRVERIIGAPACTVG